MQIFMNYLVFKFVSTLDYLINTTSVYLFLKKILPCALLLYRTCPTITRSYFETALNYKPWILDPKIEEFPCLVHKLSVTLTAGKNRVKKYANRGL